MIADENEKLILILGGSGFISYWILEALSLNHNFILTYNDNEGAQDFITEHLWFKFNITDNVENLIDKIKPDIIINLLMSGLPGKKISNKSILRKNFESMRIFNKNLSKLIQKRKIFTIFVSTDFIFDGKRGPYNEDEPPTALNLIGKLYNEIESFYTPLVKNNISAIIRASLLLGISPPYIKRKNFYELVKSKTDIYENARFFKDCFRTPSHILNLVFIINKIIDNGNISGIFHVPGEFLSYEDLVEKILHNKNTDIKKQQLNLKENVSSREIRLGLEALKTKTQLKFKNISLEEIFDF